MGVSRKSYGKKSDKETQSPVLKIFKDIMQKENTDPEKVTLLKDKQRDRKKKSYSESRSKSDQRSYDSSSTDRYKGRQTKITVQDIQEDEVFNDRSRSQAFQNEKRESWWLWNDQQKKKKTEDTCSCVSCALKKIVTSEYSCIACLLLLFSISVVIIFIMVFKMPDADTCYYKKASAIKEKRQLTESYQVYTERNKWQNEETSRLNYVGDMASEYPNDGIQGSEVMIDFQNILGDLENGLSGDLAHILENEKMLEGQNSERLRDFFKKLIQTDSQIRKLKQAINYNYQNDKTFTERFKRSLKDRFKIFHQANKDSSKEGVHILSNSHNGINDTQKSSPKPNNITGFIIRKEKILIRYEPDKQTFPKYSHHHELKSHEKNIKHYFRKNNQMAVNRKSDNNTHSKVPIAKENIGNARTKANDFKKEFTILDYKVYDNNVYNKLENKLDSSDNIKSGDYELNNLPSTTLTYDVTLTTSTSTNLLDMPDPIPTKPKQRPGHRHLMQVDEEKEEISYEDLKEVLNDDQQDRDDIDRQVERKKRDSEQGVNVLKYQNPYSDSDPNNIHNFNGEVPLPLYPDELNAMIKQAALQNINIQVPVNTKDTKVEKDRDEKDISDREYIEDYVDNKFNKMVKMAQAYSDYGVVYGKIDSNNNMKDNVNTQDQNLKFIFDKQKFINRFFRKPDKVTNTLKDQQESGRETILDQAPKEQNEFMKRLGKHVRIFKDPNPYQNTLQFTNLQHQKVNTPNSISLPDINTDTRTSDKNAANDYQFKKVLRSLKSIEINEKPNITLINSSANNSKANFTNGILDFLFLMSDWFSNLAGLSGEKGINDFKSVIGNGSFGYFRSNATGITRNRTFKDIDFSYPSYDLDMVDNINHKSRVLMSVKDNNDFNENSVKNKSASSNDVGKINSTDFEDSMALALVLAENIGNSKENKSRTLKIERDNENKTIVKRNSDNKVFWNDLYDSDEYGVPIDYLDGARNKHSINRNVIQKSKDWLKNKLNNMNRKIKDTFRKKNKCRSKNTKTTKCDLSSTNEATKKRPVRQSDNNEDNDVKRTFAMLTANMKKVCQKAARELESSKHIGVREENKEDAAATTLMQQLVRLMADLVNIQVEQKTCAKLPPDLRDFLEWLTVPTDSNVEVDNLDISSGISDYVTPEDYLSRYGKSTNPTLDLPTYNEDTHQDDRTECLGIIRSVQDLIQRYEEMTDEDKSKMTGIREYLDNQLEFLNRKLSVASDNNLYKLYEKRQIRNRRDVWNYKNHGKEGINKFIKTFGKKHTKSTLNTYNGVTMTKNKNSVKNVGVANVLKYRNN